jgi:hypothetical protein
MQCTIARQEDFALQHKLMNSWAIPRVLQPDGAIFYLLVTNLRRSSALEVHGSSHCISVGSSNALLVFGAGVLDSLLSVLLSVSGGLEGAHFSAAGLWPNATVLTAIAAFLLLFTRV